MIRFLDLYKQYESIKEEIDAAISSVIKETAFINGTYAAAFEEEFAEYIGVGHCIACGNGTDALEIAIESLNFPPKSEIIVPANSFIASGESVTRSGHKVVFCDVDPETYTISPADLASRITDKTAAVMAVHLYGHPCDMDAIKDVINGKNIRIIEDCAQAHGAQYKGQTAGTIGDIATFSFFPGKNLGAYGDAGAITTHNSELAKKCRMIANHGRIGKYNHEFEGRNSRMDGIQAAILSVKLKHLPAWTEIRRKIAGQYNQLLHGLDSVTLPVEKDWARHVYHLYVVRTGLRDDLKTHLEEKKIKTGIHYPTSLAKLPAYKYLKQYDTDMFANKSDTDLLSLPIGDHLTDDMVALVCNEIRSFFSK